jgi:hypothetical protein
MSEDYTKIVRLLEQILRWTKTGAIVQLKPSIQEALQSDEAKLVYEYSDGEKSTREISKLAGVSHATVANYWEKWSELGIVEPTEKYEGGRFRRLCSLRELGIALPKSNSPVKKAVYAPADTTQQGVDL